MRADIVTTFPDSGDLHLPDTPAPRLIEERPEAYPGIDPSDIRFAQDLLRVSKRMLSSFSDEFAIRGLTPGRYSVLMSLYVEPDGLAPSEIAERTGVTRATISGLIGGLLKDGLVECDHAPDGDRRRKTITLSKAGHRLLDKLTPEIFAQMTALVAPLTARDRDHLTRLFRKLETILDTDRR